MRSSHGFRAKAAAYWATRDEPRVWLVHAFDHACETNGIEHRTTKPAHPWTNGQVERMNRTLRVRDKTWAEAL